MGRIPTDPSIHGSHSLLQSFIPSGQRTSSAPATSQVPQPLWVARYCGWTWSLPPNLGGGLPCLPPSLLEWWRGGLGQRERTQRAYLILFWDDRMPLRVELYLFKCPGGPLLTGCCLCPHHNLRGFIRDITVMGVTWRDSSNSAGDWAESDGPLSSDE